MKDFIFIAWNFHDRGGANAAQAMLRRCDLRHLAHQEVDCEEVEDVFGEEHRWNRGSYGSIRLPAEDTRLPLLMAELRAAGIDPNPRADREYSKSEIDNAPWLEMDFGTSMFAAGPNIAEQVWDHSGACEACGSGARCVPPLLAVLGPTKGRRIIGGPEAMVVTMELALKIQRAGLSGVEFLPVRSRKGKTDEPNLRWMRVTSEWPPWSPNTVVDVSQRCDRCGRSGNCASWNPPTEIHYERASTNARDFNLMWEYWALPTWVPMTKNKALRARLRPFGGRRAMIVSQRVRRFFQREKIRCGGTPVLFDCDK